MSDKRTTPARPKHSDERVVAIIASKLAERIAGQLGEVKDGDAVVGDLVNVLKYTPLLDGYELAKNLEAEGWEVDANLVEELDCVSGIAFGVLEEAERLWVKGWDVQTPFKIGDLAEISGHNGKEVGEVRRVEADRAWIWVKLPSRNQTRRPGQTGPTLTGARAEEARPRQKTVRNIMKLWLIEHGYDGLFVAGTCACELDELAPCAEWSVECQPGYRGPCDCGDGCDFHIGPEKEE